jgi:hypothetical protein
MAVGRYEAALTPEVARYLAHRGITEQAAVTARLGVVDDPAPGHGKYVGWLAIPYLRADGEPLSLRFRCLEDHEHKDLGHGKYMSISEDEARVYGVESLHGNHSDIHLTEGEFDRNVLRFQMGWPAVGMPGASGWQPKHRRMLAGFSRVWIWGDPDDAGAKFVNKVSRSLRQARGVQLRVGDVTETWQQGGTAALAALIEEASQ